MGLKYVLCTFGAIEDEIYDFDTRHKSFQLEDISSTMTKVEMAKDIYFEMWIIFDI